MYFGDYLIGQRVLIPWSTNNKLGASVSRSQVGQVNIFRASTGAVSSVGVNDTPDVAGLVGIAFCAIDLLNSFYQPHDDYLVVLSSAMVDGELVNHALGEFSIMNRSHTRLMVAGTVDISQFPPTPTEFECSDIVAEAANNNLAGRSIYGAIGNALIKQVAVIDGSAVVGGKGHFTIPQGSPLTAAFSNGDRLIVV